MATLNKKTVSKASFRKEISAQSRLNFRLSSEVKDRIARAAAMSGTDLTEFAVAALNEKANAVIEQHENLLLGSADFRFFLDALDAKKVKKSSSRSQAAAAVYRGGTRKGVRYHLAD